jgi:hypothetical protein
MGSLMNFLDSLYGTGDYADSGNILPYAITPQGDVVPSFPAPIQSMARTVARAMGGLPTTVDPMSGLLSEDVMTDAASLAGLLSAGKFMPRKSVKETEIPKSIEAKKVQKKEKAQPSEEDEIAMSDAMYKWATGESSAKDAKKVIEQYGYTVDMRERMPGYAQIFSKSTGDSYNLYF